MPVGPRLLVKARTPQTPTAWPPKGKGWEIIPKSRGGRPGLRRRKKGEKGYDYAYAPQVKLDEKRRQAGKDQPKRTRADRPTINAGAGGARGQVDLFAWAGADREVVRRIASSTAKRTPQRTATEKPHQITLVDMLAATAVASDGPAQGALLLPTSDLVVPTSLGVARVPAPQLPLAKPALPTLVLVPDSTPQTPKTPRRRARVTRKAANARPAPPTGLLPGLFDAPPVVLLDDSEAIAGPKDQTGAVLPGRGHETKVPEPVPLDDAPEAVVLLLPDVEPVAPTPPPAPEEPVTTQDSGRMAWPQRTKGRSSVDYHAPTAAAFYGSVPEWGAQPGWGAQRRQKRNAVAVDLARELVEAGRAPTVDERETLKGYSGAGGTGAAGFGALNEYYTPPKLAAAIWRLVQRAQAPPTGGPGPLHVLEPSAGTGVFAETAPRGVKMRCVELSPTSAQIATLLHPDVEVIAGTPFEAVAVTDLTPYNVVIGNPPFGARGAEAAADPGKLSMAGDRYALDTALDKVEPAGIVALIVPASLMSSTAPVDVEYRARIARKGALQGAWRLPTGTFKDTSVVADVVIFKRYSYVGSGVAEHMTDAEVVANGAPYPDDAAAFIDGSYFAHNAANVLGVEKAADEQFRGFREVTGTLDAALDSLFGVVKLAQRPAGGFVPEQIKDPERRRKAELVQPVLPPYSEPEGTIKDFEGVGHVMRRGTDGVPVWRRLDSDTELATLGPAGQKAVQAANGIGERLLRLRGLRGRGGDPSSINELREQIVRDLQEWQTAHGIPAHHRELVGKMASRQGAAAFVAAVGPRGELCDLLGEVYARQAREVARPDHAPDLATATRWACQDGQGIIDSGAVARYLGDPPDVDAAVEWLLGSPLHFLDAQGQWTDRSALLSGRINQKRAEMAGALALVEHALEQVKGSGKGAAAKLDELRGTAPTQRIAAFVRAARSARNLEQQAAKLRAGIEQLDGARVVVPFDDIPFTIRDGFIPKEAPEAFLRAMAGTDRWRLRPGKAAWILEAQSLNWGSGQGVWRQITTLGEANKMSVLQGRDLALAMLAALNHANPKGDAPKMESKTLDARFRGWIETAHEGRWARDIEDEYNEAYFGYRPPIPSADAMELEGWDYGPARGGKSGWTPHAFQYSGANWMAQRTSGLLCDDVGLGKSQPLNARILTPSGWRIFGDLEVGDPIVDPTGGVGKVEGVYDRGLRLCHRISTLGGDAECCDEHLWPVYFDGASTPEVVELRVAMARNVAGERLALARYSEVGASTLAPVIGVVVGERVPMQCIKVSTALGTYVTDGRLVTHNTTEILASIAADQAMGRGKKACVVVPKPLVWNWEDEAKKLRPGCKVKVIGEQLHMATRGKHAGMVAPEGKHAPRDGEAEGAGRVIAGDRYVLWPEGKRWPQSAEDEHRAKLKGKRPPKYGEVAWRRLHGAGYTKAERARAWSDAAQNDYDLLVVSRTAFQEVGIPEGFAMSHWGDTFDRRFKDDEDKDKSKRARETYLAKHRQKAAARAKDGVPDLGDLGIGGLYMDEAHAYKNLVTARTREGGRVRYLGGASVAVRAEATNAQIAYLKRSKPDVKVFLATATPVKNSPMEVYTMVQQTSPEVWERRGVGSVEHFITRFCKIGKRLVLNLDGTGEEAPVVLGFKNLQELRGVLDECMLVRDAQMVGLDIPRGVDVAHTVPMTAAQKALYERVRDVIGKVSRGEVDTSEGAKLAKEDRKRRAAARKAARAARKKAGEDEGDELDIDAQAAEDAREEAEAALDAGLDLSKMHVFALIHALQTAALDPERVAYLMPGLDPAALRSPKLEAAADRMATAVLEGSRDGKLHGQVAFVDTNALHDKLKLALIERGVPEERIGIINAQVAPSVSDRQAIADRFQRGELDVVVGNTQTMGEGVNLQKTATDMHHLDIPWDPGSLQQREGRSVRQKNPNEEVKLHYYLTEGSFDGYKYSAVAGKKGWLHHLWHGQSDTVDVPTAAQGLTPDDLYVIGHADPEKALEELEDRKAMARRDIADEGYRSALERFRRLCRMTESLAAMVYRREKFGKASVDVAKETALRRRVELFHEDLRESPYFPHKEWLDLDLSQPAHVLTSGVIVRPGVVLAIPQRKIKGDPTPKKPAFYVEVTRVEAGTIHGRKFGGHDQSPGEVGSEHFWTEDDQLKRARPSLTTAAQSAVDFVREMKPTYMNLDNLSMEQRTEHEGLLRAKEAEYLADIAANSSHYAVRTADDRLEYRKEGGLDPGDHLVFGTAQDVADARAAMVAELQSDKPKEAPFRMANLLRRRFSLHEQLHPGSVIDEHLLELPAARVAAAVKVSGISSGYGTVEGYYVKHVHEALNDRPDKWSAFKTAQPEAAAAALAGAMGSVSVRAKWVPKVAEFDPAVAAVLATKATAEKTRQSVYSLIAESAGAQRQAHLAGKAQKAVWERLWEAEFGVGTVGYVVVPAVAEDGGVAQLVTAMSYVNVDSRARFFASGGHFAGSTEQEDGPVQLAPGFDPAALEARVRSVVAGAAAAKESAEKRRLAQVAKAELAAAAVTTETYAGLDAFAAVQEGVAPEEARELKAAAKTLRSVAATFVQASEGVPAHVVVDDPAHVLSGVRDAIAAGQPSVDGRLVLEDRSGGSFQAFAWRGGSSSPTGLGEVMRDRGFEFNSLYRNWVLPRSWSDGEKATTHAGAQEFWAQQEAVVAAAHVVQTRYLDLGGALAKSRLPPTGPLFVRSLRV